MGFDNAFANRKTQSASFLLFAVAYLIHLFIALEDSLPVFVGDSWPFILDRNDYFPVVHAARKLDQSPR